MCQNGTRKLSKVPSSPKNWHVISNTNLYTQPKHIPNMYIPTKMCQDGTRKPSKLHSSPQVFAWYIQYKVIYSTNIYSKTVHSHNNVSEWHRETLQITFLPQELALYIHYKVIYLTDTYSKNVHSHNLVPEWHNETLQITFISQVFAWYSQYKHIFSQLTYIPKMYIPPTLCPKGTRKPSKLHSSPKCWHDIFNTNLYIQL